MALFWRTRPPEQGLPMALVKSSLSIDWRNGYSTSARGRLTHNLNKGSRDNGREWTCKASEGEVWVDEQWWRAARECGSLDRPVLNEMVAEMETCCQLQHWLLRPGHVPLFIASSPLVFTHRLCYLSGISNVAVSVLFKLCFFSFFSLTFEQ